MSVPKFSKILLFSLNLVFIFSLPSFAQTTEETLTISTYYPAPYGVYNELRSKKMAIGDTYYNATVVTITDPADLLVEGNVGIGTASPNAPLGVTGSGTYNSESGPLRVISSANLAKSVHIGYDNVIDAGFISPVHNGVTWKNLLLNPSGGNVGIGTVTPKNTLDVRGQLHLQDTNNAAVIYFPLTGTSPNLYIRSDDDLSNYETTNERMFIGSNGRVGIGTTNPERKLSIQENAPDAYVQISNTAAGGRQWNLISSGTGSLNPVGSFGIQDQSTLSTRFLIDNSGDVGIGTTSPDGTLDVMKTILGLTTGLRFSSWHFPGISAGGIINSYDDGGTVRSLVLQNNGGNVGIGTTAPDEKLHVAGNIRSNSAFAVAVTGCGIADCLYTLTFPVPFTTVPVVVCSAGPNANPSYGPLTCMPQSTTSTSVSVTLSSTAGGQPISGTKGIYVIAMAP